MQKPAPIIQAVDRVAEDLREFVYDPDAKGMLWEITDDSAKIVEMALTLHMESEAFVPALVLPFEAAFEDAATYGAALCAEFDAMLADDDPFGETPVALPDFTAEMSFGERMAALGAALSAHMKALVIFYAPAAISDGRAFADWIAVQTGAQADPVLRMLVVDEPGGLVGERLMAALGPQIMRRCPAVSMNALMRKTLAATPPPTTPAERIGRLLPKAIILLREEKKAEAREHCIKARQIARDNDLKTLEMTAGVVLANGWFADLDHSETRKVAQETVARHPFEEHDSDNPDHRTQADLRMQAQMLCGTAWIAEEEYAAAAPDFEAAAETAALLSNAVQHFEGLRLASWCYGMADAREEAWRCGVVALDVAADLPEMLRKDGTLPFLLFDLDGAARRGVRRDQLDELATALLGPDWREIAKDAVSTASGGDANG